MASSGLTLQNLVEAIMNSIADAQDQIERQTIDNIHAWFDEDGRPKMMKLKVPVVSLELEQQKQDKQVQEREIEIPLITLMQNNPIKIKKLIAKFEIALGGIESKEEKNDESSKLIGSNTSSRIRKILSTDLFAGDAKKRRTASMEIEFESGEPTEAYLKLQNELLKLI